MRLQIVLAMCIAASPAFGAPPQSVDTVGDVGVTSSLALDAAGNPVVSYSDTTNQNLKVLHCNDPNCAGGDESIESPDTAGFVGLYTSLALDADGNPVISYLDNTNGDLKVMHCNDPNCAGGDESIASPDTVGNVGYYTSLELDAAGNPVVSYYDQTNGNLKLLHCYTPTCATGGTIERVDVIGVVGTHNSLALDALGLPVISYHDVTNGDLKVVHCDIASCADGQISYSLDTTGIVGEYTSLVLDASGNPVVSYLDRTNGDLKLLHCYTPDCATGGTVERAAVPGTVGLWTSLALDAAGKPVISYLDATNSALKVVHCDIASCADGQISVTVDNAGDVGSYSSLALDAAGNPVISYYDGTLDVDGDLKLVHCGNPTCATSRMTLIEPVIAPAGTNGWYDADAAIVVSVPDPGVVETRCVLDPTIAPSTFDDLPASCDFLGTGAAVTADGEHTLYAASMDSLGTKEIPVSISFRIDQSDPLVAYSGNAGTYSLGQQVSIDCAATDAVSGIASANCADIVASAASLGPGVHSFNASATDNAGNTGTGSVSFTVEVTPVDLCQMTLQFAQGSARYQNSTPSRQQAFRQVVGALCANTLTPIVPGIPAARKRALIAAYKIELALLVAGSWLTRPQAESLGALASEL